MKNIPKKELCIFVVYLLLILLVLPAVCFAVEAAALKQLIDQGEKVTVIDIRNSELYKAGHIVGAINISANIIDRKPLPPVGKVVVCGDGVRTDLTMHAVDALNRKRGIEADFLQGGFAAWSSLNMPKTQQRGIAKQQLKYITYQDLKNISADNHNMLLVDIRLLMKKNKASEQVGTTPDMSNLSTIFPGVEIFTPIAEQPLENGKHTYNFTSSLNDKNSVYVIVGNGDGIEEEVSRHLYGAGIQQNLILLGGERIIKREGRAGSSSELPASKL